MHQSLNDGSMSNGGGTIMLRKNLRGNASTMIEGLPRKSLPAGLPSGFSSNATARNQFGKVLNRPSEAQFNARRDGS